jgi:hypothetical protein
MCDHFSILFLSQRTISLLFDNNKKSSKFYIFFNDFNLMIFDGQLNDNELYVNLKNYQSINKKTYYKKIILYLFKRSLSKLSK